MNNLSARQSIANDLELYLVHRAYITYKWTTSGGKLSAYFLALKSKFPMFGDNVQWPTITVEDLTWLCVTIPSLKIG
jgi:hypothetical protein